MKVVQLTFNDYGAAGGTSVTTLRYHQTLIRYGVQSKILCRVKGLSTDDSEKIKYPRVLERVLREITSRIGLNDLHAINSFWIPKNKSYREADVLHLHSLHSGFFNYLALPMLTKNKPTVWNLHDVWPMTGHCAVTFDCQRWKTGCGHCPYPGTYPPVKRDATALEWKLKKWAYQRSRIAIVVTSHWLADMARQSLLGRFPIHCIPYGINSDIYKPLDPDQSRRALGIPAGKKVVMFMAVEVDMHVKGGDLLREALRLLPGTLKKEIIVLTVGHKGQALLEGLDIEGLHLGYVEDEELKVTAFSVADVFVCPSRFEAFGSVVQESMACGTPVVSFAIGAFPEMVRHGVNGYTARPESVADLSKGIQLLLEDDALRQTMRQNCRAMTVNEFTIDLWMKRHIDLYKQLLN